MKTSVRRRVAISTVVIVVVVVVVVLIAAASVLLFTSASSMKISTVSSAATPSQPSTTFTSSLGTTSSAKSTASTNATEKATLMLPFPPTPYATWLYYGISQGIYSKYGISLNIVVANPATVVPGVSTAKADFGFIDPGTGIALSLIRSNITNVRTVAIIEQRVEYTVIYNTATIHSLKDLNGKTYGTIQGSASAQLLPEFARLNGINYSSIKITSTTPALVNSLLATGKVDFITQTVNALADATPVAAQNNIKLGLFPYAEHGLDIYGEGILTSTQLISSNPNLVQRFVKATMESLFGAIHNPAAAVAALVTANPQLNATVALKGWALYVGFGIPDANSTRYASDPLTLGWMDQQKMQQTADIVATAYGFKSPSASLLYTNQFVRQP